MNYTAYQIQDALDAQNIDSDLSRQIAWAIGDQRLNEEQVKDLYSRIGAKGARLPEGKEGAQGSGFLTNLADGVGYTLGELAWKAHPALGGMVGSTLGNIAGMNWLGGDKYFDRITTPQVLADMAGGTLGGMAGKAVGSGISRALGGAAGAAAGRVAGGTLGSLAGPIGTAVGSALGGWLLPKLLPDGSKSVAEDDGSSGGGWGTLGTIAAVPLGYKAARKWGNKYIDPLATKIDKGVTWLGGEPLAKGRAEYNRLKPQVPKDANWWGRQWHGVKKPFGEIEALTEGGTVTVEELMKKILRRQNNATTV